ncbi:hypothetical protein Tco_1328317 [Tanacetum coccineum]
MLEDLGPKMLGLSLKLIDFTTLVLLRYTLTSGVEVIMGVLLVDSLGGTIGLEVILVKGYFVPFIMKVLHVVIAKAVVLSFTSLSNVASCGLFLLLFFFFQTNTVPPSLVNVAWQRGKVDQQVVQKLGLKSVTRKLVL